jgi:hypothetical protein
MYERDLLPSQSSIQKASYELYVLGQQHTPFHRRQCHTGEVYQYDFELFMQFILKPFLHMRLLKLNQLSCVLLWMELSSLLVYATLQQV